MRMKRYGLHRGTRTFASMLVLAAAGLLVAGAVSADDGSAPRKRLLSKEFQNTRSGENEISTTATALAAGAGGTVIYDKTLLEIPDDIDVLDIEFQGQGDSHNGSALLMNASVNGVLCQPLLGQTGPGGGINGVHVQTGWYTLGHLPQSTTGTNCNDGGGGTGDCHDNTIVFSCCARIESEDARVQIKLANLPGGPVTSPNISFIERTLIVIEGTKDNKRHSLCTGVSRAPHTEDLGSR